jgi:hypothetical protein
MALFSEAEKKEFVAFVQEFVDESDRAAVILGAAKIDTQLYQILQRVFVPQPSSRDDLLDTERPLSSFSSRINIVYRVGLIDAEFVRALHLIRRIRNTFAHELSGVSLSAGPARDRIRELVAPLKALPQFFEASREFFGGKDKLLEPSSDFRVAVAWVSVQLHHLYNRCQTLPSQNALGFVPPHLKESTEKHQGEASQNHLEGEGS